jgi:hypothetical protein
MGNNVPSHLFPSLLNENKFNVILLTVGCGKPHLNKHGTLIMDLFFSLLLAHLIADFPLQTNWIFAMKLKSSKGIALHVLIHLIVTAFLIRDPFSHLPMLAILGVSHFSFDWLKLRYPTQKQVPGFLVDQSLHLITLVFLAIFFADVKTVLSGTWLHVALFYAFIPPVIMAGWLLAIDMGRVMKESDRCVAWAQRRLLPISQQAGMPLLFGVSLGILLF